MPRTEGETYFNNFLQTGYEEMKSWTPSYYREIKEADANLRFAGKTIDLMALSLEDWCLNMFIDTMSEETLSRMEAFYYLDNSSRTLDERRRLLKAAQLGSGKMDVDRIKRIISVYANVDCSVEFIHEMTITLDAGDKIINFEDFTNILGKQMPAHIAWFVHQEMAQNTEIFHGANTFATYIPSVIREVAGDRERDVDSLDTSAGTGIATVNIAVPVVDGGDRTREIEGNQNSGAQITNIVAQTIT